MWVSSRPRTGIVVARKPIELVAEFLYLGSMLKKDGIYDSDIQQRCAKANLALNPLIKRSASRLVERVLRSLLCSSWKRLPGRKRKFWTEEVKGDPRTLGVEKEFRRDVRFRRIWNGDEWLDSLQAIAEDREGWAKLCSRAAHLGKDAGSKRLLSTVFSQMAACGIRPKKLWHDVKLIIVKTVLAMLPELMIQYEKTFSGKEGPQCFQIVGFDIIVQADGSPILLEVNACPSLTIDHGGASGQNRQKSVVDEVIKIPLVRDTLLLVTGQLQDTRIRDCGYEGLFMTGELEKKIYDIRQYYVGDCNIEKGLFFHGFLSFVIYVAERQFPKESSLQKQLQKLFDAVTNALRNKGVRSRRLRREELESNSGRASSAATRHLQQPTKPTGNTEKKRQTLGNVDDRTSAIAASSAERKADRNNNKENFPMLPPIQKPK
ncbi:hypothetical protein RB195_021048 [Necator americanus]|uniref:Tubulin-tyrosine ligase family protein n=1 Tax=Necator americanus TaxID=51031 RepID=A0ABR1E931_NECAM